MKRCFMLKRSFDERVRDCFGVIQEHHVIQKQRIVKEWRSRRADNVLKRDGAKPMFTLSKALADQRNLKDVCWGHHQLIEPSARLRVEVHELPIDFWHFVDEYQFFGLLPRHLKGLVSHG